MSLTSFYESYLAIIKEPMPDPKDLSECLIGWYCAYFGEGALRALHSSLTSELGKFHPEDSLYEDRTAYILNLILYSEASSPETLASPYEVFCRELLRTLHPEMPAQDIFFQPHHSIFFVKRSKKNEVSLLDLCNQNIIKFELVADKREHLAFSEKSVIQAFLLGLKNRHMFIPGCVFHPQSTLKTIQKFIAFHTKDGELDEKRKILKYLAATQLNHFRLSHVLPEKIYGQRLPLMV